MGSNKRNNSLNGKLRYLFMWNIGKYFKMNHLTVLMFETERSATLIEFEKNKVFNSL